MHIFHWKQEFLDQKVYVFDEVLEHIFAIFTPTGDMLWSISGSEHAICQQVIIPS